MATTAKKKATPKKTAKKTVPRKTAAGPIEVTSVSKWKQASEGRPMGLPSGNVAKVRNPGLQAFIREGMVPNALMPIVQSAIDQHKGPDPQEVMKDPQMIADTMTLMDNLWLYCVTDPATKPLPPVGHPRNEDDLYVDDIDLEDKVFIFQFVGGGTSDLERFRKERSSSLVALQSGKSVDSKAKRAPRNR